MENPLESLQNQLEDYLVAALSGKSAVRVTDCANLSVGWESDVFAFTLHFEEGGVPHEEALVLRIYPGKLAWDKSAHEFNGLTLLFQSGYPVPQVWLLEREHSPFGKPFLIMERVDGESMWPLMFHSGKDQEQRYRTVFCELFYRLHMLDWESALRTHPDLATARLRGSQAPVRLQVETLQSYYDRYPKPGFLPVLAWVQERQKDIDCWQQALIHWDFHPANILVSGDGSATVIDWTQLEVSDMRFDLAWTLVLIGAAEGRSQSRQLLAEYERIAGTPVPQLDFFEVIACLKRLFSVVVSMQDGAGELGMRPGAEAIMARQMGAMGEVYRLLLERTGISVAEVEQLLAAHRIESMIPRD